MFEPFLSLCRHLSRALGLHRETNEGYAWLYINSTQTNALGECYLEIASTHHANTFLRRPSQLASNDRLLEGFSKRDVRTITYLAAKEQYQPRYYIISQQCCANLKRIIFKLRKRGTHKLITRSAHQLSHDKPLLNKLSQEEAHTVGFATATEAFMLEQAFFAKRKTSISDRTIA